jgi:hypothetical protein
MVRVLVKQADTYRIVVKGQRPLGRGRKDDTDLLSPKHQC